MFNLYKPIKRYQSVLIPESIYDELDDYLKEDYYDYIPINSITESITEMLENYDRIYSISVLGKCKKKESGNYVDWYGFQNDGKCKKIILQKRVIDKVLNFIKKNKIIYPYAPTINAVIIEYIKTYGSIRAEGYIFGYGYNRI